MISVATDSLDYKLMAAYLAGAPVKIIGLGGKEIMVEILDVKTVNNGGPILQTTFIVMANAIISELQLQSEKRTPRL